MPVESNACAARPWHGAVNADATPTIDRMPNARTTRCVMVATHLTRSVERAARSESCRNQRDDERRYARKDGPECQRKKRLGTLVRRDRPRMNVRRDREANAPRAAADDTRNAVILSEPAVAPDRR
jgi:hypothetical protein